MDRYAVAHASRNGPGDARPTALQIVQDELQYGDKSSSSLSELTIVITGATSGIGYETAQALYATGAKLFITARDTAKARQAIDRIVSSISPVNGRRYQEIEVVCMDMDSLASMRHAAGEILTRAKTINVLINNAGIAEISLEHTKDGLERNWGVNYIAHFLLTHLLLPRLEASSSPVRRSRIVNLSTTGHRLFPTHLEDPNFEKTPYEPMSAYATSKLALIYHANYLDRHFSDRGIRAVSVHPGTIRTPMLDKYDALRSEKVDLPPAYAEELKSAEQGAATTVFAAIAACLEDKGGVYLENCTYGKEAAEDLGPMDGGYAAFAFDEEVEERLWKDTCKLLGVSEAL
ncbi:NAD(P)-binding protein [Trichoderma reesei RUT C-30]|uniref:NAD(P)-binding protein n=1 Tax=Hypocrea jecorina (strain ATCC 56765 / BCRC 32924 / NRRL 11460 / Rut C-30) TaxID=1344414 RepID=A0A024SEZ5_HYPJR|nr:NAD(P)-binding protein [Trichoderma reesei RUT C-30]